MAKKTIKFYCAMFIGKLARNTQKALGMNATYFPGKLALRICPDFLSQIGRPEHLIGVTGTNGKTTVSNLIVDMLLGAGYQVTNNRAGSNTAAGIASALLINATITGKAKNDWGVLEIDERSSMHIYPKIKPDYVVCTNLFRDSIQRNAHTDYIAGIVSDNMQPNTRMILNADDLISGSIAPANDRVYYSISRLDTDKEKCENLVNDCQICPKCHARLEYEYVHYHHIGKAHCTKCDFSSPKPDYEAKVNFKEGYMLVDEKGKEERYELISDSIFNVYNELTVITLLRELGISAEKLREGFGKFKIVDTRYNKAVIDTPKGSIEVIDHMAKGQNMIACSLVFDYISREPGEKELLFLIDEEEPLEIMTWMYDCDYEKLNRPEIRKIIIPGIRGKDQKLRLLMAGIPEEKICVGMTDEEAPDYLDFNGISKVFVMHQVHKPQMAHKLDLMIRERIKEWGEKA